MRTQHPSVYHSKKLLAHLAGACRLALYVDIHGHSTKEDAFFYGWVLLCWFSVYTHTLSLSHKLMLILKLNYMTTHTHTIHNTCLLARSCEPNLAGLDRAPVSGGNVPPSRQVTVRPGGTAFEVRACLCAYVCVTHAHACVSLSCG